MSASLSVVIPAYNEAARLGKTLRAVVDYLRQNFPDGELIVDENNTPTQPLVATINGQDVTGQVTWSMEKPLIGDVQGTEYVPSGGAGGVGTLTAVLGSSFGQATATVYVTKVIGGSSIDPAVKAQLDAPSGSLDAAMDWSYPADQTVFPLDVLGPELWELARDDRVAPTDRHAPGIPVATLRRAVERLEEL